MFLLFRDKRNGAVIARSSQPEVGWLGWRSAEDETLLQAIPTACAVNGGHEYAGTAKTGDLDKLEVVANGDAGEGKESMPGIS